MSAAEAGAGTRMFAEAGEAAGAVARLLADNRDTMRRVAAHLRSHAPAVIVTLARGSSDNAATAGRYLLEDALGVVCASGGLSLGSIYRGPARMAGGLCIAISQSGASPDLLAAVERARAGGAFVLGLINQPGAPLADLCDEVIALSAAPETSVAATKSCITSVAALAWLAAEWSGDAALLRAVQGAPGLLAEAWSQDWSPLVAALRQTDSMYVLGRGPGLGAAQEAALKLKETCQLHAEAFSAAEVVHGPMALVGPGFQVLALAQADASRPHTITTIGSMVERGASVLVADADVPGATSLPLPDAHAAITPMLALQAFYRAAANLSCARGLDPDAPPHLSKVTRTQ